MAETGQSKNVENWQKMIAACNGMGAGYQPATRTDTDLDSSELRFKEILESYK